MPDTERLASMYVREVETLADVAPQDWDRISAGLGLYYSHAWLRMLETNPGARVRYLLASRGGTLLAGLPIQQVRQETLRNYLPEKHAKVTGGGRWLLVGTRRAYASGVAVDPAVTGPDRLEVMRSLVEAAREYATATGHDGVVWMYATTAAAAELVACGARAGFAGADAVIQPPPGGVEGYLSSFPSKARREMRREMRVFEAAGYQVTRSPLSECWAEAGALQFNIQRKYGHETTLEAEQASLRNQAAALDAHSLVLGVRADSRLTGFLLLYRWAGTLYARVTGFDYDALRRAYEYFNLTYYRPIALLDELGLTQLHLGTGSLDTKIDRGAVLRPLWMVALPAGGGDHHGADTASELREWRKRYPGPATSSAEWEPAWSSR
ncbi:GNAT family N-acetyltransferase [Actinoplanes sp. NPDC049316]|uniref:GNAT family N-acetyltransferase n=1 Tax=Actinoplanes sp. NPDC049316 TaxID=3154727 RepID=UPI003447E158